MIAVPLSSFVNIFKKPVNVLDDDWDKIITWLSSGLMLLFCAVASANLSVGKVVECFIPKNYPESWHKFVADYCYTNHLIHPFVDPGNSTVNAMTEGTIAYYPWIPFFFFFHGVLFFLPHLFWPAIASRIGVDIKAIAKDSVELAKDTDKADEKIKKFASFVSSSIHSSYEGPLPKCFAFAVLPIMYFIKKWLYVVVCFIQFWIVCSYIGDGNWSWGFEALQRTMSNSQLLSGFFPMLTWCDVPIHKDNSYDNVIVSCVLGMNVIFEKLYIASYFWMLLVIFVSVFSAVSYSLMFFIPLWRYNFVKNLLQMDENSMYFVEKFTDEYLGGTGFLLIMVIKQNCNPVFTNKLVQELWNLHKEHPSLPIGSFSQSYLYESLPHH